MKATANIPVGAVATQEITVTREMTVAHFHEQMPEVYGTPIMIYHLEVTAEAAGGVIHGHRCAPQISRPGETNEAISQIFPL